MRRYVIRSAFWAGFGKTMAVALGSTGVALMTLRGSGADPLSVSIGALIWIAIGVICGLESAESARRMWDEVDAESR